MEPSNKRSYSIILLCLILLVAFFGCGEEHDIDEEFFIPVTDSNLYVRLIGNADKPIIINLHGGPGAFSSFDHEFNKKYLEEDYLIAYLDQRGGGKSEVSADSTQLTMQQFVEDLDVVVDSLQHRFKGREINLIGSSWGGTLGLLYMIEHQDKINSFACVSGKAQGVYPLQALIKHEKKLAIELLEGAADSISRNKYLQILTSLQEMEGSDLNHFADEVDLLKNDYPKELGFDAYWANSEAKEVAIELGKDSAYFARAGYTKSEFDEALDKFEFVNRVFRNSPDYNHLDILNEIGVIHKPVLVIQGEYDYVIGVKQAEMIFNALKGVSEDEKELKILPNASHNLNLEAEEQYYHSVKAFFDKYND